MITSMKFSKNETTKIHAIKTDGSGDVQTFDTGIFFQMIHTGNSYLRKDNILVVDATVYQNSSKNVYEVFDLKNLRKQSDLLDHQWGSLWKRFELNLETGAIISKDLIKPDFGAIELPTYND